MRLYASQALEPVATVMVGTASVLGLLFGTLWWLSWRLLASRVRLAEVLARRTARAQHRQRALADSREVNRALVGAARQAGAVVRQRLGAELHDNTGQLLTAAQLQARHLALVVDPMLQPACETLADTLRDAAKAVRELSHDWHLAPTHAADAPDLLAELGRLAERSRPLPGNWCCHMNCQAGMLRLATPCFASLRRPSAMRCAMPVPVPYGCC